MYVGHWSRRQLLLAWMIGLVVQVGLVWGPGLYLRSHLPKFTTDWKMRQDRWDVAEQADSLSLAQQRADARARGDFRVTQSGETTFAVVSMPSGRPKPVRQPRAWRFLSGSVATLAFIQFGLVPTMLIALTVLWLAQRRAED